MASVASMAVWISAQNSDTWCTLFKVRLSVLPMCLKIWFSHLYSYIYYFWGRLIPGNLSLELPRVAAAGVVLLKPILCCDLRCA